MPARRKRSVDDNGIAAKADRDRDEDKIDVDAAAEEIDEQEQGPDEIEEITDIDTDTELKERDSKVPKTLIKSLPPVYAKHENLSENEIRIRKDAMLAFMKMYSQYPDKKPEEIGDMLKIPPEKARDYLNHFIGLAVQFGKRTDFFEAIKYAYNTHLTQQEYDQFHLADYEIKVLLPLVDKHGSEHKRIARMQREGESIIVPSRANPNTNTNTNPNTGETLKTYNNPSIDYNSNMTQQQQQEQTPEEGILATILTRYNVMDKKIPDVIGMWRQLRLTYLSQPGAFYNMLRTQVGEVQAKGIAEAFTQSCIQNLPSFGQESPAMANALPMQGVFPTQPMGYGATAMTGGGMMQQYGQQQQNQQQFNPQQMQWLSAGIPPPPGPGSSQMDMWLWKQIYDSWQEEQRFKRASQQNVNKILGNASGNGGGSDNENMMMMMMMMNQKNSNIMFFPETLPDGRKTWKVMPNPNPQQDNGNSQASDMTKAVIQSLTQIASTTISNKNNPSPVDSLFQSVVGPLLNKSLNNVDQIEGIKKMIEVGNMLQRPNIQESPEIAQQKIDAKFALWREELEWRKTVREWDQTDKREKDAASQQDKYLSLFKEWGKDAVPQLMAIFGKGLIGALGPKMSAEQLAAAAQQRYAGPIPQQQMPPNVVMTPNGPMQVPPGAMFNPFQGPNGMQEGLPPQVMAQMQQDAMMEQMRQQQMSQQEQYQNQHQQQYAEQTMNPLQMQQPQQPLQPFMPGQQQLESAPGPEQFMHLQPSDIDNLYDNVHNRKRLLEQYENNLRIARNKLQTTPQPMYSHGPGMMGQQPQYQQQQPVQQQQQQQQQQPQDNYGDDAEYEFMPANSMTEAEEAQRTGEITPNDMRNAVQQNVDMNMGGMGYPQQQYEQPSQGYENVNWQAMQETDPTENQLPVQSQRVSQQQPNTVAMEGMSEGIDSMPELNQSIEPIPGTEMQGTGASASTPAGKAANDNYRPQQGQPGERVIRKPNTNKQQ